MSDGRDTVWVGLDLGTSSLKAVALDGSGAAVAEAREGYDTARPGPGLAEQDPASWTGATRAALATIAARVPPQSWGGIGLSGMIPTLAMVDAAGEPLHPALTWEDCRAHAEASEIADQAGGQALYELTGQPLDGRYLLPMFAWFLAHQPEVAERAALLLSAKDYLFYWLTGQAATDPSTATGYGCYDLGRADWLPHVAALAHVSVSGGRPGAVCRR